MHAAQKGHVTCMVQLLEKGAAIDQVDAEGRSPLMCALEADNPEAAMFLIQRGADICMSRKKVRVLSARKSFHSSFI